jgi:hypothetical protein
MRYQDKHISEEIYVVDGVQGVLLGRPALRNLGILGSEIYQIVGPSNINDGKPSPQQPDAKRFCVTTPRHHPYPLLPKVERKLQQMVEADVIEPVREATEWCHPIVTQFKKDNQDDLRLCFDLKNLNKYIVREVYQSPTPSDVVANIPQHEAKILARWTLYRDTGRSR